MTSQTGQQTIAIHILPNISRTESNETMKFGQLTKNIIKKILDKMGEGETIPRPVSEKSKLSISLDQ